MCFSNRADIQHIPKRALSKWEDLIVEAANEEALLVKKALRTTKTMESEIAEPQGEQA